METQKRHNFLTFGMVQLKRVCLSLPSGRSISQYSAPTRPSSSEQYTAVYKHCKQSCKKQAANGHKPLPTPRLGISKEHLTRMLDLESQVLQPLGPLLVFLLHLLFLLNGHRVQLNWVDLTEGFGNVVVFVEVLRIIQSAQLHRSCLDGLTYDFAQ